MKIFNIIPNKKGPFFLIKKKKKMEEEEEEERKAFLGASSINYLCLLGFSSLRDFLKSFMIE